MRLSRKNIRMSTTSKKRIGLIGAGYWGKNLIRVFNQLGALKTICDSDRKVLRKYPKIKTTLNFQEILDDKEIKGVVICTPASTHYSLVKKALLAGKDVLVEKPLALSVKEGKELVNLSKKNILMIDHLLLYHPAIIKLKKLIKEGKLGEIRYICSNRLNFGKLRKEENVLWSFAPHDISVIIDIMGMPKKVKSIGKNYLQKNIPDITLSSFEFTGEKAAHVFVSWLNPFKEQKLSIIGSKAMAVFDGVKNELIVYPYKVEKNLELVKTEGKNIKFLEKEPLIEVAKHFLECITKRKFPKTNGKEALSVLEVLEACQKSLNQNGKSINL